MPQPETLTEGSTVTLTITLPSAVVQRIRERVVVGEFASESEVVADLLEEAEYFRDILPPLDANGEDKWIQTEVVPTLERLRTGEEKTYTLDEVFQHFEKRRQVASA